MVCVGILEDSFVIWVDVDKYPWGDGNRPYIFLASLKPNKMSRLKTSKLYENILEMLRLVACQQLYPTATSTLMELPEDSPEEPEDEPEDPDELAEKLEKLLAGW